MQYHYKIDVEAIKVNEVVFILDFSFPLNVMKQMLDRTKNIIWIDHHGTAIDKLKSISDQLDGIRDITKAGCVLTWDFFNGNITPPHFVNLIGDYDIWTFEYPESMVFHTGMLLEKTGPEEAVWDILYRQTNDVGAYAGGVIERGRICINFRKMICNDYLRDSAFAMGWRGFDCLVNGLHMFGSLSFGDAISEYSICISYTYNGDEWLIGLYSEKVDVGRIASEYGGGGHRGAAGFTSPLPPWEWEGVIR